ncbi:AMP-binding protein [Streptomyces hainanensis]|uniref:AMP-dependent synthetase/ligase domain-containing protein n=1 Tax=Streptomyces hainanensis TaxID=402648 RepID=A0A4R4THD0_9ACTN|nr:AMP-binding protein [Streptomyces hainanensis]TDC74363.1 hypothetical protein E1283_15925 [Streptomyces hainanensis]
MSGDQHGRGGGFRPADVLNHAQLLRQGEQAALMLARLGVRGGDPVAVLLPMCLESVVITLACIRVDAQRITLPLGDHEGYVRHRIASSGAEVVVTADSYAAEGRPIQVKAGLDRALTGCPQVRSVVVVPQFARPVPWTPDRDLWWHEGLAGRRLPSGPYPEDMSSSPPSGEHREEPPADRLVFDDPLQHRSADDSDGGWGDHPPQDTAGDLARFVNEKPPHHL